MTRSYARPVSLFLILWLVVGIVAAAQRGYLNSDPDGCNRVATIGVTVIAGPLNYVGLDPKVHCEIPQPS
ncbi:hypothetical protein [Luteimicrobium subarcticum]|uniref:Uncharacterized protein n=1 Tax=Luteimicrobium subarcticum TaxID=620910 RepID=A0A2M8WTA6_9MICO|nr:hypothetical protein [Luteimicrobium subarcticum]PJI94163.1 hypothetical protein CLV34_1650 [Luteimicrobium subarcticum]